MGKIGGRHWSPGHLTRTQDARKKGVINSEVNIADVPDEPMVGNPRDPCTQDLRRESSVEKELTILVVAILGESLAHQAGDSLGVKDQPDKLILAESVRHPVVVERPRQRLRSVSPGMEGARGHHLNGHRAVSSVADARRIDSR